MMAHRKATGQSKELFGVAVVLEQQQQLHFYMAHLSGRWLSADVTNIVKMFSVFVLSFVFPFVGRVCLG